MISDAFYSSGTVTRELVKIMRTADRYVCAIMLVGHVLHSYRVGVDELVVPGLLRPGEARRIGFYE